MGKVVFEVSVLTPPEPVEVKNPKEYLNKIKVGEDGLIVERGFYQGSAFAAGAQLNGVGVKKNFFANAASKQELPPDSWLTKDAKIYKFKAIIFEEETPLGEVKRLNLDKQ